MLKIDLHTHSEISPDGGLNAAEYKQLLKGTLDYVAVTDHDEIGFAQQLQKKLGDKVIVGEEITTSKGEIIGLFLKKLVAAGQSPLQTAQAIHAQGGLVYVPHPFETVRKGLEKSTLDEIAEHVDIIEAHNGRAIQNRSKQALAWAKKHDKLVAASSDAHGKRGAGHTYTAVVQPLTATNFREVLTKAKLTKGRPPIISFGYPKVNRLKKKLRRS